MKKENVSQCLQKDFLEKINFSTGADSDNYLEKKQSFKLLFSYVLTNKKGGEKNVVLLKYFFRMLLN